MSLLLIAYLAVTTSLTSRMAREDVCKGLLIEVNDTSANPFVTADELARELHGLVERASGRQFSEIDTDSLRSLLQRIDKIEDVRVVRYADGYIRIFVDPMHPVARIFDRARSYYINRQGKRISADARYRIDVPIISGQFADTAFTPLDLLPLIDWLEASEKWGSMVTMIKVDSPTDILLIPAIHGQVINFGEPDPATFDDKFRRLDKMYADVLPVKGWNYYDTISVKWNRQVVATRRDKSVADNGYVVVEEHDDADVGSMMTGDSITVAPSQTPP